MMKFTMRLRLLSLGALILLAGAIHAQKFGHLNYGNLLLDLPQVVSANQQLETFQKDLVAQIEAKYTTFQSNYDRVAKQVQGGELSPVQQEQKEAELKAEQEAVAKFERDAQQKLMLKREELLKPILLKVESAVTAVGEEGGYSGIFDSSNGQLLYAIDTEDVMALVKAKL